jgi:peptide/nickel transport system permease protein
VATVTGPPDIHPELAGGVVPDAEPIGAGVTATGRRRRRRLGFAFWLSVAYLAAILFGSLLADLLPLDNPTRPSGGGRETPSLSHWMGTDNIGQDIFSRVIYGARVSLFITFAATLIGIIIGSILGVTSGYYKHTIDTVITRSVDLVLAMPAVILALSMIIFFDNSGENRRFWLTIVLGILSIPPIARVIRASTITFSDREFVQAARTLGARHGRIIMREVFPNVIPTILSYAFIWMAILVVVEAGIGFLGLSVPPPTPTWGDMINKGRNELEIAPYIALMPSLVLFLTVLSLNYIGDKLRSFFDVRESFL